MENKYFLEIEKKYDLYHDTIEGIHYWNYARFGIWNNYILKENLSLGTAHNQNKRTKKEILKEYLGLLKNSVIFLLKKTEHKEICIIDHPRRIFENDRYECKYTDELAKQMKDCMVLEVPYLFKHMKPVGTENIRYLDILLVEKMLYYRMYRHFWKNRYRKLLKAVEEKVREPFQELEEVYGSGVDYDSVIKYITDQVIYCKANIGTVRRIVKNIKPKLLIEVVSYNLDCMMFTEVCKSADIPVIELQHGILTDHIAYNYSSDEKVRQIPDKIFLFSNYWKRFVHMPIGQNDLVATGFPYFEKKKKEVEKIAEYDDGKVNIIFISQGTIGKKLSQQAKELSKILNREKYRIFYKLHPGEYAVWREQYEGLEDGNIVVLDNSKDLLYNYFATCQIQVGVYSTALYEGLGFGLKTFIYKTEMSEQMKGLSEAGYVAYFSDAKNLKNLIEQSLNESQTVKKADDFWMENALANMKKSIELMICDC